MEIQQDVDQPWGALGLSEDVVRSSPCDKPISLPEFDETISALCDEKTFSGFDSRMSKAVEESVAAYASVLPAALAARNAAGSYLNAFDVVCSQLDKLSLKLETCEADIIGLQMQTELRQSDQVRTRLVEAHVSAFVDEVILDPALVRHIVDGRVGDDSYSECLSTLRKKAAVYDMRDSKRAAACKELLPVLRQLIATAAIKVRSFLLSKIDLLRKPNTNVQIIKHNVLLKHRDLVAFLDELSPSDFRDIKAAYIETISPLYLALFRRYASGLMALKVPLQLEVGDSLVCSDAKSSTFGGAVRTFPSLLSNSNTTQISIDSSNMLGSAGSTFRNPVEATRTAAASTGLGLFTLGSRIEVLEKIDAPAIVLVVAEDNNLCFHYEELHRSLGRMLSETCASEHTFCESFFGDAGGNMFDILFKGVVDLLVDAVTAHAASSNDMIGILLALKVNEAQRTSMQHRNIFDLSDYFIRVDIALKPKFKRLFDANINSLATAKQNLESVFPGVGNTKPISVTRRFAELSSAVLSIAFYGASDDAILEGLRRFRTSFNSLLMAVSAMYKDEKSRYVFLVNNVDLVMTVYATHGAEGTTDARFFNELQVGYTAAYVEQEVSDHFPDFVAFVRAYDRRLRNMRSGGISTGSASYTSETHLRAVLREFASNWHLVAEHMRENVLRAFPNYRTGNEILRALFARLFSYHRQCEAAVDTHYPVLKNELVAGTEISYEVRQLSKPFG